MKSTLPTRTYRSLRSEALECYYEGCYRLGLEARRPHEEALGYVGYNYENALDHPMERLMMDVILLVLGGGLYPQATDRLRSDVARRLQAPGLRALLDSMSVDDRTRFLRDLQALSIALPSPQCPDVAG